MKTLLIFPPQGHFTQPYLALPSLKAYLKQEGFSDTHIMDANIEAYEWMLSPKQLQRYGDELRHQDRLRHLDGKAYLDYAEMLEHRALSQAELASEWVVENIEEAKSVMREEQKFYDREQYTWAARCMEQAMALVSARFFPTQLSAHGFSMRYSLQSSSQILQGSQDEKENPYLEFFREVTMPKIRQMKPNLIGISLTYGSQAIPAFSLARMIKMWNPKVHIVFGGGLLAYIGHKLARRADVFDLIDSMVLMEGEGPMLSIAKAVRDGCNLAGIPNVIYRDPSGVVLVAEEKEPLSINSLPTPDFEGLPFPLYFSPEFIVPLSITRGCYWGKCVFCTLHEVIGPGYRGRSIEKVIEDIQFLQDKWKAKRFYFPIEDLPPNMVKRLPQAILDAGLSIDWWCDAKLEPEVFTEETCRKLVESGCKRLAFGYESASGRVLDLMCKGSQPEPGMEVIRRVHDAGISVTLYVMVGFPTETEEEADLTLQTLLQNRAYFEEASMRVFYLDYKSEAFRRPKDFGIEEIYYEEGMDLQVYHDFRPSIGMSRAQARKKYLNMLASLKSYLPVFQNRNLLYHELKSHYFLYLARAGSVPALLHGPFAIKKKQTLGENHLLRKSEDLLMMGLRFDRGAIDQALEEATDNLTLPRYQFDLIAGKELQRLQNATEPINPLASVLVLHGQTGEMSCLSPEGKELLDSFRGTRCIQDVLAEFSPEVHHQVLPFLNELYQSGLLTLENNVAVSA